MYVIINIINGAVSVFVGALTEIFTHERCIRKGVPLFIKQR